MSVSSVSDLQSHTGFWLRLVSNHVSSTFAGKLAASGISVAEWVALREAYKEDSAAATPSALADLTGLTRGAATKIVDRLVAKKLLTRHENPEDRRFQEIRLTAAGRRLVPVLASIADRNDEEYFAVLSRAERTALVATLRKLARSHNMRNIPIE